MGNLDLREKHIMVTGGAGFVGSHLVDRIAEDQPESIVVVDNYFLGNESNLQKAKSSFMKLRIYSVDASDYQSMRDLIWRHEIEIIFNLAVKPLAAGFEDPVGTFSTNGAISSTLCELLRQDRYETLVHFSSSEVYGSGKKLPMSEDHPLKPTTPYGAGKAAADLLTMAYYQLNRIDALIIRPFNTYGPRQNDKQYAAIIPTTIKRILSSQAPVIFGDGLQTRDFTFVSDVVEATIQAYKTPSTRGRQINIGSGQETSIKDLVGLIMEAMQFKGSAVNQAERPGDIRRHQADISLAESLIGYRPSVSLKEGISRTIQWYRASLRI